MIGIGVDLGETYLFCSAFYINLRSRTRILPVMDLPAALERMLTAAVQSDTLRNWSIYQERDGVYTFKLRFISRKVCHILEPMHSMDSTKQNNSEVYKRKNAYQINRDMSRAEEFYNRRVTRSQTVQSRNLENLENVSTSVVSSANSVPEGKGDSPKMISVESPDIETFRHSSFALSAEAPEFELPQSLDCTDRDDSDVDSNITTPPDCLITGGCHNICVYGSNCDSNNFEIFNCSQCEGYKVCSQCVNEGAHSGHSKYLTIDSRFKVT